MPLILLRNALPRFVVAVTEDFYGWAVEMVLVLVLEPFRRNTSAILDAVGAFVYRGVDLRSMVAVVAHPASDLADDHRHFRIKAQTVNCRDYLNGLTTAMPR